MSQKMIRVSEGAYWALKQTAAAGRLSMAELVDRLVAFARGPVAPVSTAVAEVPSAVPDPAPVEGERFAAVRAKAFTGPFSKAAQMGKK